MARPGRLRLSSDAELEGPWSLDQPTRAQLGTPSLLTHAWILRCPVSRAEEKPSAVMGEWAQAFPDGMPVGLEYRVLEALGRMARRLAGGLRMAGSGYVMVPDADSAVNLTVYSPRWINPEDLLSAMRERAGFEQMKDARDIVARGPAADPRTGRADREAEGRAGSCPRGYRLEDREGPRGAGGPA